MPSETLVVVNEEAKEQDETQRVKADNSELKSLVASSITRAETTPHAVGAEQTSHEGRKKKKKRKKHRATQQGDIVG